MKKFISILVLIVLSASTVLGATQTQLNNKKTELNNAKTQLNNVKKEESSTLNQINNLDQSINSTETQIENTEIEIGRIEESIKITEQNIEYAQKEYDEKYALRTERVLVYYKLGASSVWDVEYSVEDETEALHLKRLMCKIMDYDNNLVDELEADRIALDEKKTALEEEQVRCANLKAELEEKKLALEETREKRVAYMAELKSSESALSASVDKLNAEAKALEAELAKAAASSSSTKYTGGSMTWPLPGYYIITSPFGNRLHPILKVYKLHTGVDIAGAGCNGASVVAANSGTVIKATYSTAYGNYIVIDHGGGITTLYAHSSKLLVKAGDYVTKGQEIMKVGTTGYSTGPHLHFEVRENGTYVNPLDASKGYLKN
ncbi:MAG: peptidoglycan DD-metalloendopeptidase family protein [Clostridia bacterium]|nr:peptidoglycan DD-metalloendopeptidase family protein [Clostridia bacterium]